MNRGGGRHGDLERAYSSIMPALTSPNPGATMTDAEYFEGFNSEFWRKLHGTGVGSLSRLQRDALCVMNFQAELNNGGMHQYLLNSSGEFAKETPDVFRRIGAEEAARILDQANAFFGPGGPPTDRESRMTALLAFPKQIEERIYTLSKQFYDAEDRGLSLADLFDAYVLSQKGERGDHP
jgi:hypothetical protein